MPVYDAQAFDRLRKAQERYNAMRTPENKQALDAARAYWQSQEKALKHGGLA